MKPLLTITTDDPIELGAILRLLGDRYVGEQDREMAISYGLTGVHITVGERGIVVAEDEGPSPILPLAMKPYLPSRTQVDDETLPEDEVADNTITEAAARRESPASDPDGQVVCDACEATFRTGRALSDHVRASHWDDVIEAYDGEGVAGIVEGFGVAKSTAYRWATDIRGDAA